MPVKRRTSKARMKPHEECGFWADFFDHGGFLLAGWETELGLPLAGSWRERQEAERSPAVMVAARDAWRRLGAQYLDGALGHREGVDMGAGRWALAEFGEPPKCH
jgi:hypothetical protein